MLTGIVRITGTLDDPGRIGKRIALHGCTRVIHCVLEKLRRRVVRITSCSDKIPLLIDCIVTATRPLLQGDRIGQITSGEVQALPIGDIDDKTPGRDLQPTPEVLMRRQRGKQAPR